ncbi:BBE domain-containing protein [Mycobacterium innocens]|uniref:BBE domain-containing protein n=1 Tax=Mycobacterium innocens TaxID=2341083 RepID=UPI003CC54C24
MGVPGCQLLTGDRRCRPGPGERRGPEALDGGLLGRHPSVFGGRRIRRLHDGRGPTPGPRHLRSQLSRLSQVKATYDPHNVFHINQNIVPAG